MEKKILWPLHSIHCMDMDSAIYWTLIVRTFVCFFFFCKCRLCAFVYVPDLSYCHFDCSQPETYLYFYYTLLIYIILCGTHKWKTTIFLLLLLVVMSCMICVFGRKNNVDDDKQVSHHNSFVSLLNYFFFQFAYSLS